MDQSNSSSSDSEEKKKLKKGKSKMFISPEHHIKMTKALTSIAEIYGHYFEKKKFIEPGRDLQEAQETNKVLLS